MNDLLEHEASQLFPIMNDGDIQKLADDIEKNGQLQPITVVRTGERRFILDGRNRLRACQLRGIAPKIVVITEAVDPVGFVVSANLLRRHLTASQRSVVAARLATLQNGYRKDLPAPCGAGASMGQHDAAEQLKVSRRNVQRARRVLDSGTEELVQAVESGKITVTEAERIVDLPAEERINAIDNPPVAKKRQRVDHAQRKADVLALHQQGKRTSDIASELGLEISTISMIKVSLGVSDSNPSNKVWKSIEHVISSLEGSAIHIATLIDSLESGVELNVTKEEVHSCAKRLSIATAVIKKLSSELRRRGEMKP